MPEGSPSTGEKRVCGHRPCRNPVPSGRERYCSLRCRKAAKSRRNPSQRRAKQRAQERYRERYGDPYGEFVQAAEGRMRIRNPDSSNAQAMARKLVAEGAIAYENRDGLIRDIGAPKDPADAGRVFSKRPTEVAA